MTKPRQQWALITGASSGLGMLFARELAARGFHLVLTARRETALGRLAAELSRDHGTQVLVEALDLAVSDAALALIERLEARGVEIDVLVNNAGFGVFGPFDQQSSERVRQMLRLNILALTDLTLVLGKRMVAREGGHILLVSSMAAYQPTPLYAAYGASKAYVLSLGEALQVEWAPKVGVTVLSPGLMDTGFLEVSGQQATSAMRKNMVDPLDAVRTGLDAMFARKPSVIIGRLNRFAAFVNRFTSRRLQARLILRIQQK